MDLFIFFKLLFEAQMTKNSISVKEVMMKAVGVCKSMKVAWSMDVTILWLS